MVSMKPTKDDNDILEFPMTDSAYPDWRPKFRCSRRRPRQRGCAATPGRAQAHPRTLNQDLRRCSARCLRDRRPTRPRRPSRC
jgi:hypothetical protein